MTAASRLLQRQHDRVLSVDQTEAINVGVAVGYTIANHPLKRAATGKRSAELHPVLNDHIFRDEHATAEYVSRRLACDGATRRTWVEGGTVTDDCGMLYAAADSEAHNLAAAKIPGRKPDRHCAELVSAVAWRRH